MVLIKSLSWKSRRLPVHVLDAQGKQICDGEVQLPSEAVHGEYVAILWPNKPLPAADYPLQLGGGTWAVRALSNRSPKVFIFGGHMLVKSAEAPPA